MVLTSLTSPGRRLMCTRKRSGWSWWRAARGRVGWVTHSRGAAICDLATRLKWATSYSGLTLSNDPPAGVCAKGSLVVILQLCSSICIIPSKHLEFISIASRCHQFAALVNTYRLFSDCRLQPFSDLRVDVPVADQFRLHEDAEIIWVSQNTHSYLCHWAPSLGASLRASRTMPLTAFSQHLPTLFRILQARHGPCRERVGPNTQDTHFLCSIVLLYHSSFIKKGIQVI